jgi:proline racemase
LASSWFTAKSLGRIPRGRYTVIDSHTAGAVTRFLVAGAPKLRGRTIAEKKTYFVNEYDHIRTTLMQEPRGNDGVVAIPASPTVDAADLGVIFADYRGYVDMCIHGTIGVVTTLVECGLVDEQKIRRREELIFETPAGIVRARYALKGKKTE